MDDRPTPANQRLVVLEFGSAGEAEAWDAAGQPLDVTIPGKLSTDFHHGE